MIQVIATGCPVTLYYSHWAIASGFPVT